MDSTHPDPQVREKVYAQIAQEALVQACAHVGALARPAEEEQQYRSCWGKYVTVRAFLPTLLRTVTLQATPAGRPILEAGPFSPRERDARTHRLVQVVLLEEMKRSAKKAKWAKYVVQTVESALPPLEPQPWEWYKRCLGHVLACVHLIDEYSINDSASAHLLYKAGNI